MFRSWSKSAPPARPDSLVRALDDLRRLVASRPELRGPAATLSVVMEAVFRRPEPVPTPPTEARIGDVETLAVDRLGLVERARALGEALRATNSSADRLLGVIDSDPSRLEAWGRMILAGRGDAAVSEWEAGGLAVELVAAVVRLAWLPSLSAWSQALTGAIERSGRVGGVCPVCGSAPLLAEARGLEARHFLRCGRCAAEWPAARLGCPACGKDDPRSWGTIAFENQAERYRLGCCRGCGFRLKIVATLAPLSTPALLVAELATLHLDALPGPADQGTG
jgi:hypothetical protein